MSFPIWVKIITTALTSVSSVVDACKRRSKDEREELAQERKEEIEAWLAKQSMKSNGSKAATQDDK
jgi:hypothetical protein